MPEEIVLTPVELRQAEVAQYDENIRLYESLLQTLPTEWPAHLVKYRGTKDEHGAAAELESLADVELLSKLLQSDQCRAAIRAETLERTKAAAILAVLEAQA